MGEIQRQAARQRPTKEIQPVYSVLDNYHNNNESKPTYRSQTWPTYWLPASSKDKDYYLGVLEEIQKLEVSADTTVKLIHSSLPISSLGEISLAAYEAKEGRMSWNKVQDLFDKLRAM
jgi:hypothetical protein